MPRRIEKQKQQEYQKEIMTNRGTRKAVAQETLDIIARGFYMVADNPKINIGQQIHQAISGTRTYSPEDLDQLDLSANEPKRDTEFCVKNATTFKTARELLDRDPDARVLCLNFASAKNPGGGFLGGSQAQEEALCRASALFACINPQQEYYTVNRKCGTSLYTDYMIYSPMVPVFRDDRDALIAQPYCVSIVTSPAVNKGALANSQPRQLTEVEGVMSERITKLLSLAVANGYEHLVLGAWGCGVFRNDPRDIARQFCQQLSGEGRFAGAFKSVHFGVLDFSKSESTYRAFTDEYAPLS